MKTTEILSLWQHTSDHFRILCLLGAVLLGGTEGFSQGEVCGTDYGMSMMRASKAQLEWMQEQEKRLVHEANMMPRLNPAEGSYIITIPVVVHILEPAGNDPGIIRVNDLQIASQLEVLNEDFRRLNPDAGNTRSIFQSVAADVGIEFCLQQTIRKSDANVTYYDYAEDAKFDHLGGSNIVSPEKFLNIWVVQEIREENNAEIFGYAQFPTDPNKTAATDGVVVQAVNFGRTGAVEPPRHKGRVVTHEVGHWLNLHHIWGPINTGGCGLDDGVSDTPEAETIVDNCDFSEASCNSLDMVENYMTYTGDACQNMFTLGQRSRMLAAISLFRPGLLTSKCSGNEFVYECPQDDHISDTWDYPKVEAQNLITSDAIIPENSFGSFVLF